MYEVERLVEGGPASSSGEVRHLPNLPSHFTLNLEL